MDFDKKNFVYLGILVNPNEGEVLLVDYIDKIVFKVVNKEDKVNRYLEEL